MASVSSTLLPVIRTLLAPTVVGILLSVAGIVNADTNAEESYLSPNAIVVDEDRDLAFVTLEDRDSLLVVNLAEGVVKESIDLPFSPAGLTLDEKRGRVAVTGGHAEGKAALFSWEGELLTLFSAGFSPTAPVFLHSGKVVAVCERFADRVGFYELPAGRLLARVSVAREPIAAVAVPEKNLLFVANALPHQNALADEVTATIDVIDTRLYERGARIPLPNGSSGLQDMAIDPSGRYLFVTHILGRYQVPTSQLERGWMNSNAVSIIDTGDAKLLATVLLDDTTQGAANPWGVTTLEEGKWLAVTHYGTHELSRLPLPTLIERMNEKLEENSSSVEEEEYENPYADPAGLSTDLELMAEIGRVRYSLNEGPRALASWKGNAVVIEYFEGALALVDLDKSPGEKGAVRRIRLGEQPQMSPERLGELRFGDARLCFQQWQSCVSCHPGQARTDAMNWDLLNDGVGNPKQTKSMLFSHETPPAMITGIRDKAEVAVRAGIRFIQFAPVDETDANNIDAYLKSLRPKPSPYLVGGELSPLAVRGKKIFGEIGCADCHSGPYFTDMKKHGMRYSTGMDKDRRFDTPTLIELWRTAPYLYDGRAASMEEALLIKSSRVEALSEEDRQALAEYVLSL